MRCRVRCGRTTWPIRMKEIDLWQVTAGMSGLGFIASTEVVQRSNSLIIFGHPVAKGGGLSIGANGGREDVGRMVGNGRQFILGGRGRRATCHGRYSRCRWSVVVVHHCQGPALWRVYAEVLTTIMRKGFPLYGLRPICTMLWHPIRPGWNIRRVLGFERYRGCLRIWFWPAGTSLWRISLAQESSPDTVTTCMSTSVKKKPGPNVDIGHVSTRKAATATTHIRVSAHHTSSSSGGM